MNLKQNISFFTFVDNWDSFYVFVYRPHTYQRDFRLLIGNSLKLGLFLGPIP